MALSIGDLLGHIGLQDEFSGKLNAIGDSIQAGIGIALGERIVRFAEAAGQAILGFADNLLNLGDEMTNTSERFGAGVEALQKFNVAGAAVGVTGTEIAGGLRRLQVSLADGNEEIENAVKFLGLSTQQLKSMKPEEQLQVILEKTSQIPNAMDRTAVATELLGRAGARLVPLGQGLADTMQKAEDLGIVMSANTIKAADDLGDEMGLLGMTFDGLKNNIASVIVESEPLHVLITGLTDLFGELSVWVKNNEDQLRSFVDAGVVFVAESFVHLVDVAEVVMAVFKALADVWTVTKTAAMLLMEAQVALWRAASSPLDALKIWNEYKEHAKAALEEANKDLESHQNALNSAVGVAETVKGKFQTLADAVANAAGKHHEAADATRSHGDAMFKSAASIKAQQDALKKNQEAWDAFQLASARAINEFNKEQQKLIQGLSDESVARALVNSGVSIGADLYSALGKEIDKARRAASAAMGGSGQLVSEIKIAGEETMKFWSRFPDEAAELAKNGGHLFGQNFKEETKGIFDDLPSTILGAIQGGGNVFQAIGADMGGKIFGKDSGLWKSATGFVTEHLGETMGKAVGNILPGIGTLVGPLIGGLADKIFGGLFGGEEKKVNDMRDAFLETFGGWEKLHQQLAAAGDEQLMQRVFNADTVKEFNQAVEEVNSLLGDQAEMQKALDDAIQKYGFSIEELGPKFQQQRLMEQAQQLFQEFTLLKGSGIDVTTVIEHMGPAMNEFLNTAIATGQAIPEAMRPMVEQFIASGQLLDANGEAFTSAEDAGVKFSKTLDEQFETLIEKLDRFINALMGIGDVEVPAVNVPVNFRMGEGIEAGPGHGIRFEPFAEGGIVHKPTIALIGEEGPEAVVPLNGRGKHRNNLPAGMTQPMQPIFNISIGGREVREYFVEQMWTGAL